MILKKNYCKNFGYKVKATIAVWKNPQKLRVIPYCEEAHARASVFSILSKHIPIKSIEQEQVFYAMADEIFGCLKKEPEPCLDDRIKALGGGLVGQAFWYHSQLSGLAVHWEFKIRLFAQKIGISSYEDVDRKSKQNQSKGSIQQKKLSIMISEINRVTGNRLTLKLTELLGLRDAIIHCNPQSMRPYAQAVIGKDALKNMKGDVMMYKISDNTLTNLSDVSDGVGVEDYDLFSWFLEIYNSGLPRKAFSSFESSIHALNNLTNFSAYSFDGREIFFKDLLTEGKFLSAEEIKLYKDAYANYPGGPPVNFEKLFSDIKTYFK